jgi:hypothetical protein
VRGTRTSPRGLERGCPDKMRNSHLGQPRGGRAARRPIAHADALPPPRSSKNGAAPLVTRCRGRVQLASSHGMCGPRAPTTRRPTSVFARRQGHRPAHALRCRPRGRRSAAGSRETGRPGMCSGPRGHVVVHTVAMTCCHHNSSFPIRAPPSLSLLLVLRGTYCERRVQASHSG